MWRNLQNNTDVSLIINFQCILHIFTLMHLQTFQRQKLLNVYGIFWEPYIKMFHYQEEKDNNLSS